MNKLCKIITSGFFGAIIGVALAEIISSCLTEISETAYFSVIFGVILVLLGGALLWRVLSSPIEDDGATKRYFVVLFSVVILGSGIICFLVNKELLKTLSVSIKIPLYIMLGVSLSFALTYSIVELMNMGMFSCLCCRRTSAQPLVGTPLQVFIALFSALLLGGFHGYLFGSMDIEDDDSAASYDKLQLITLPTGAALGFFIGAINEHLRQRDQDQGWGILDAGTYNDSF